MRVEESIGAEHRDELLAHYDCIKNQSLAGACRTQHMLQESFDLTKSTRHRRRYRILTALWVGITYAKKECPYLPMLVFCLPLKELR
jgi:hypothetical protein